MTDEQRKELIDAMQAFCLKVLNGQGNENELEALPNVLAILSYTITNSL